MSERSNQNWSNYISHLNLKAAELQILLNIAIVSRLMKQDSHKSFSKTLHDGLSEVIVCLGTFLTGLKRGEFR